MKITLDLPADVFDDGFSEEAFAERMRQWAILALVDAHRLHEHEAARMLGLERWELVERMEAQGIRPTEQVFEEIRAQLAGAIAAHAAAPQQGRTTMRLLHTMIRVNDLDQSLKFYCGPLGMKLLSRKDYPDGKFTLAFVGYGDENATRSSSSPTTGTPRATSRAPPSAISRSASTTSTRPATNSSTRA